MHTMQNFSNSPLVQFELISPYKSIRTEDISRLTIHVVSNIDSNNKAIPITIQSLGNWFHDGAHASSNYGIAGGKIGLFVPESHRSWCSSNTQNDNKAITIECENSGGYPDYAVSDITYSLLIKLIVDIMKRNNKSRLLSFPTKEQALSYHPAPNEMVMSAHRWFANKPCPGDYLYNKFSLIASTVNTILKEGDVLNMSKDELKELIIETIKEQNTDSQQTLYKTIDDVPEYWQDIIKQMIKLNIINGGTDNNIDDKDVNLSESTIKAIVIIYRLLEMYKVV